MQIKVNRIGLNRGLNRFRQNVLSAVSSGGVRGGAPEGDDDKGDKDEDPPEDDGDTDTDVRKAELDAERKALRVVEKKLKDREDKDRKLADDAKRKKARDDDKLADELEGRTKERDDIASKLKAYEERDLKAAGDIFKRLPKKSQEKLEPLREKLSTGDWLDLVTKEKGTEDSEGDKDDDTDTRRKPPVVPRGDDKTKKSGRFKPQWKDEIEEATGREVTFLPQLDVKEDRQGNRVFRLPMKDYRRMLRERNPSSGVRMTQDNAAKREAEKK